MTGDFEARIRAHLSQTAQLLTTIAAGPVGQIVDVVDALSNVFRRGGKVLLCGNGGSAADCQHMAAEFMSRLSRDVERTGLPAIALTTDTSFLTAFANDCGFEGVFARQVEALGKAGDVLIGISTSGRSPNVLDAVGTARRKGMTTVALVGSKGPLIELVDHAIVVRSDDTQHIQEAMLAIEHIICLLVEDVLFRRKDTT